MHWQFERYNLGFERFHKMLEKYSKVTFIGHAQTWWANIDKNHKDQSVLYPKGPVTRWRAHRPLPGGLSEHVRRPLGGFRAQRADARRGLHP